MGRSPFERLHVPSAPADDGNALGAAWLAYAEDHPGLAAGARLHVALSRLHVSTEPLERMAAWEPRLSRLGDRA